MDILSPHHMVVYSDCCLDLCGCSWTPLTDLLRWKHSSFRRPILRLSLSGRHNGISARNQQIADSPWVIQPTRDNRRPEILCTIRKGKCPIGVCHHRQLLQAIPYVVPVFSAAYCTWSFPLQNSSSVTAWLS